MRIKALHIIMVLCTVILASCRWGKESENDGMQDIHVTVFRYDKLLNEYIEYNSFLALKKMNTQHLTETKYLIEDILKLGSVNDIHITERLKAYYADSTLKILSRDALSEFKDMTGIERELTRGFRNLKRELPAIRIPRVYSQISALNESVVVGDSVLGFSIDKYMGKDYSLYKRFYYDYQCRSMTPERIAPDCFMFYLLSDYPFPEDNGHSLFECIMHRGKIHYVVKNILDYNSYAEELGYSDREAQWCEQNRKAVWEYMTANGHLNSTDPMIIRKYTVPAPYTSYFGAESPAMVGIWMGTQIIDAYMNNNKKVSLEELMKDNDYRRMLANSKFKL